MVAVNTPTKGRLVKMTRRERAKATRRRIAEAALARFSGQGYAATTMEAIANDAGVAVQTVYFTFHTKAELLIAALTIAGGGPGAAEDVLARDWIAEVIDAPTGPRRPIGPACGTGRGPRRPTRWTWPPPRAARPWRPACTDPFRPSHPVGRVALRFPHVLICRGGAPCLRSPPTVTLSTTLLTPSG